MVKKYVESGGCFYSKSDNFVSCALESTDCPDDDQYFLSTLEMVLGGMGSPCLSHDIPIGSCTGTGELALCANTAEVCSLPSAFEDFTAGCNVRNNHHQSDQRTMYGGCDQGPQDMNDIDFCVWSKDDCLDTEQYLNANLVKYATQENGIYNGDCLCEEVQVGMCVHPMNGSYCAVTALGCDKESNWVSARELAELPTAYDSVECFLCETDETALEAAAGLLKPSQGTTYTTTIGSNNNENLRTGIVAAVVILFLVSLIVAMTVKRVEDKAAKAVVNESNRAVENAEMT